MPSFKKRRTALVVAVMMLIGHMQSWAEGDELAGIKLLDGYRVVKQHAVDASAWTIQKKGGVTIEFEGGPNEGLWANPKRMYEYAWFRRQVVNGHTVLIALIKRGMKTDWDPTSTPANKAGNILLVTFPLGSADLPDDSANFEAKILKPEDLVDALLMILTFDPAKATF